MQQKQKRSHSIFLWPTLGLALFSGQACSENKTQVPADTLMILAVNKEGVVTVLDAAGKPVPKCQLCNQDLAKKYGPHCKEAPPRSGMCTGLTGATMQDISSVTILTSHKNPKCLNFVSNGVAYSIPVGCGS